jgi:hypothetical protein
MPSGQGFYEPLVLGAAYIVEFHAPLLSERKFAAELPIRGFCRVMVQDEAVRLPEPSQATIRM